MLGTIILMAVILLAAGGLVGWIFYTLQVKTNWAYKKQIRRTEFVVALLFGMIIGSFFAYMTL